MVKPQRTAVKVNVRALCTCFLSYIMWDYIYITVQIVYVKSLKEIGRELEGSNYGNRE